MKSGRPARASRRGLVSAGVAAVLLAGLIAAVLARHGAPFPVDLSGHRWLRQHRQHWVTEVAIVITDTGSGPVAYLLAALAGVLIGAQHGQFGQQRGWRGSGAIGALIALAGLVAAQQLRFTVATWIDRPRPPMPDWAAAAAGPALPSGHTTTAALVAALFCFALSRRFGHRDVVFRVGILLAVLWAVGVGLTRIYLGVHWPTDVVAGWLLALTLSAGTWAFTSPVQNGSIGSGPMQSKRRNP